MECDWDYEDCEPEPDSSDLRSPRCNGCELAKLKWELGDRFLMLPDGIYELGASPHPGQGTPRHYNGKPIRFLVWGMSYEHSDECYHWQPPRKGIKK
jgi:hypothetical protein